MMPFHPTGSIIYLLCVVIFSETGIHFSDHALMHQQYLQVGDIGAGRACDQQVARKRQRVVGIVVAQIIFRTAAQFPHPACRAGIDEAARRICRAVSAVGAAR